MSEKPHLVEASRNSIGGGVDPDLLASIEVSLEAYLGSAVMAVAQLLELKPGDSIPLDANLNQDVELRLNNKVIGRGELVAIGDQFAVRMLEISRPTNT